MRSSPGKRLLELFRKPPLHFHLLVMNLVILFLIFPAVTFTLLNNYNSFRSRHSNELFTQMRQSVEQQISSLMESMLATAVFALGSYEFFLLQQQVSEVATNDQSIRYLILMDRKGTAVVHSNENLLLNRLDGAMDRRAMELLTKELPGRQIGKDQSRAYFFSNNTMKEDIRNPILEGIIPIYSGGRLWGALRCGYSLEQLDKQLSRGQREWDREITQFSRMMILALATAIFLAVITAYFFSRFITNSIRLLSQGVQQVAGGDLSHRINQPVLTCLEFHQLSHGFNQMTGSLAEAHRQLDQYSHSLAQQVEDRTRELRQAQAELISQAREAGMAEMAIGVLHNIGNAITPAKVDVDMLIDDIRKTPLRSLLPKALAPVEAIIAAAPGIEKKERQRLISILKLWPRGFEEECESITNTLDKVREKHRHIEEIIRLQMRYARLTGGEEELQIKDVVTDALSMMAESLDKRRIQVETDFKDLPPVRMEHARLMQIIVNVIKNSYEAIDAGPNSGHGVLSVICGRDGKGVFIALKDNGQGFAPEESEKIFTYGYTTKEHGSGFGLHSVANFLIAQGGSISATSDGAGQGAEFVIRLPISENISNNE